MDFKDIFINTEKFENKEIELIGFVKSNRNGSKVSFLSINDGTYLNSIQVVYKESIKNFEIAKNLNLYDAVKIKGVLKLTPIAKQPFEVLANEIELLKNNDPNFPLQKKETSYEYLRDVAHVRPRTNTFWSVMKVRSTLASFIHKFFQERNFTWVSSPIFTSNDGEGAGETFFINTIDKEDFFSKPTCLSVTGQLQAEAYAQAFKKVYTFGPTFRAEKSHTSRHAAEFWMMEPEIAFCNLTQLMDLIQEMIVYLANNYINTNKNEYDFFCNLDSTLKEKITKLIQNEFKRVSYTEVIDILKDAVENKKINFEDKNIFWGMDFGSEHEKYICEQVFNAPTFVYNYPKDIKAFYMKQNDDKKTVASVDLLVPGIGELVGGSQREDDYEKLLNRCNELNIDIKPLDWYLELRKYGYYMSSGFGLGFERLIMYFTGMTNIRDVIPFPRTHGSIKF